MCAESEKVEQVVTLQSGKLGDAPDSLYVTDSSIVFGAHSVPMDTIENLQFIEHKPRDWLAIGCVSIHAITGGILASTLISEMLVVASFSLFAAIFGWFLVQLVRPSPYAYVSLETTDTEYIFGVSSSLDAASLFGAVAPHLENELSHRNFLPHQSGS